MAASQQAASAQTSFTLDRGEAVPAVVGDPGYFLIIAGLSWSAKDVGKLTGESRDDQKVTGVTDHCRYSLAPVQGETGLCACCLLGCCHGLCESLG